MKGPLKRTAFRTGHILWHLAEKIRPPVLIGKEYIRGLDDLHGIGTRSVLAVANPENDPQTHLTLGRGVWIGDNVEIEAAAPGHIEIGQNTSFQHGCVIRGSITIGANCIFARNVLVISTTHHFRDHPAWLIHDQDRAFQRLSRQQWKDSEARITVEEDCWFGFGSAVMPGVEIGRGAIIGTNCVVTHDIGPYEVHGGVPNAKITTRLEFKPPTGIDARSDEALPYFYRGFLVSQDDLATSRASGVVAASRSACIVLEGGTFGGLVLRGKCLTSGGPLTLQVRLNGQDYGTHALEGAFQLDIRTKPGMGRSGSTFRTLSEHTVIELENVLPATCVSPTPCYGLESAALLR